MNCSKDYEIAIASPATDYLWWKMEEPNGNRIDSIHGKILVATTSGAATINSGPGKILLGAVPTVHNGEQAFLDMGTGLGMPYVTGAGWTLCGWFDWTGLTLNTAYFGVFDGVSTSFAQAEDPVGGFYIKASSPAAFQLVPTPPNGSNFFILEFVPATSKLRWEINRSGVISELVINEPANGSPMDVFFNMDGSFIAGPGAFPWTIDEWGYFPITLTDPQKDYIWNLGNGRTSPIVLP